MHHTVICDRYTFFVATIFSGLTGVHISLPKRKWPSNLTKVRRFDFHQIVGCGAQDTKTTYIFVCVFSVLILTNLSFIMHDTSLWSQSFNLKYRSFMEILLKETCLHFFYRAEKTFKTFPTYVCRRAVYVNRSH